MFGVFSGLNCRQSVCYVGQLADCRAAAWVAGAVEAADEGIRVEVYTGSDRRCRPVIASDPYSPWGGWQVADGTTRATLADALRAFEDWQDRRAAAILADVA